MKKNIFIIVIIILAFFIGIINPFKLLSFELDQTPISRAEYVKILISIIAAFLTFCAVSVALFKEKILATFSRPNLVIAKPAQKANFEVITDKMMGNKNEIIEATMYCSRLLIKNIGNTAATEVAISLEKLVFKEHNYTITNLFEPSGESLKWNNNQEKINILPNSEKLINIVEIFAPKKTSTPEGKTEIEQDAELIIGNFKECNKKTKPGVWTATFVIHAQNHKHMLFDVNIEWQGKWKGRLSDFETEYKYTISN